ncbi:uncharacterized protein LOC134237858 [Saccostrea cucullata]|uniref:uncharacterized protein LOC134237858 n=1 Tax=Saccostrea cuccullata TaxID=36930 RepID=UPI002ED6A1DF
MDQCATEKTSIHTLLNFASNIVKVQEAIYNKSETLKEDISKMNMKMTAMLDSLQSCQCCSKDTCNTSYPQDCQDLLLQAIQKVRCTQFLQTTGLDLTFSVIRRQMVGLDGNSKETGWIRGFLQNLE